MIEEFRREHPDIRFELVLAEVKADLRCQVVSSLAGSRARSCGHASEVLAVIYVSVCHLTADDWPGMGLFDVLR